MQAATRSLMTAACAALLALTLHMAGDDAGIPVARVDAGNAATVSVAQGGIDASAFLPTAQPFTTWIWLTDDWSAQSAQGASTAQPAPTAADAARLALPEMDAQSVVSLSLVTPERAFCFERVGDGVVSVNGQLADGESYATLIEQIEQLRFEPRPAFTPEEEPILTLSMATRQAQTRILFYADDEDGAHADVICGTAEAAQYLRTDAWRIGMLLLNCEGARVLDASGQGTPVQ